MLAVKQDPYVRAGVVNSADQHLHRARRLGARARPAGARGVDLEHASLLHRRSGRRRGAPGQQAARARAAGRGLPEGARPGVALPVGLPVSRRTAAPVAGRHRHHREGGRRRDRRARRTEPHPPPHVVAARRSSTRRCASGTPRRRAPRWWRSSRPAWRRPARKSPGDVATEPAAAASAHRRRGRAE